MRDAFALARRIHDSGYVPDALLAVWRGGTPVGVVIHEFLDFKGLRMVHAVVHASSYCGVERRRAPRVEPMDSILEALRPGQRVLLVDDIFDTGRTLERIRDRLRPRTEDVRIATLYYRPDRSRTTLKPDFFLHRTNRWVVFPHELKGLTLAEIRRKDPYVHRLLTGP